MGGDQEGGEGKQVVHELGKDVGSRAKRSGKRWQGRGEAAGKIGKEVGTTLRRTWNEVVRMLGGGEEVGREVGEEGRERAKGGGGEERRKKE